MNLKKIFKSLMKIIPIILIISDILKLCEESIEQIQEILNEDE